jgi:hypothetical protein
MDTAWRCFVQSYPSLFEFGCVPRANEYSGSFAKKGAGYRFTEPSAAAGNNGAFSLKFQSVYPIAIKN